MEGSHPVVQIKLGENKMNRDMTEAEFEKNFTITVLPGGGEYTENIHTMRQYPPNRVWSLVEDGDGGLCLVSGFAAVNFLAWYVTEEPHNAQNYELAVVFE